MMKKITLFFKQLKRRDAEDAEKRRGMQRFFSAFLRAFRVSAFKKICEIAASLVANPF
jgi:hypothetical protein